MMKTIRVAEASNIQLDWLVAKCEGKEAFIIEEPYYQAGELVFKGEYDWSGDRHIEADYTTDWSQMGPIIEREGLTTQTDQHDTEGPMWTAYKREFLFAEDGTDCWSVGTTPLIAAARCYVTSKLGGKVEVPEELE